MYVQELIVDLYTLYNYLANGVQLAILEHMWLLLVTTQYAVQEPESSV